MGQKLAAYDASGAIFAFYDTEDSPAPDGVSVIELAAKEWMTCLTEQGQWCVANGALARVLPPSAEQQLASARSLKISELDASCKAAIYAGFTSSALGSVHTYPAEDADQQNLSASVLGSLMPNLAADWTTPFWCADASGLWSYAAHTAAQIQQVGQDGKAAVIAAITKKAQLVAQVNAAPSVEAVQSIVWS